MLSARSRPRASRILSTKVELACIAIGVACGALVGLLWTTELVVLVSWTVAAALAVCWVWRIGWSMDPAETEHAAEEENRSTSTDTWPLVAAVVSLGAVGDGLVRSSGGGAVATAAVLLSLASVAVSGVLVNTVFALKYARMYYLDGADRGGFDFSQDSEPAYSDFAYLAFTVGMAYAVPETRPTQRRTRRVVLGHALLSYVFSTGVLAVAISLLSGLGQ
jgi:uncharacterized membrane protein